MSVVMHDLPPSASSLHYPVDLYIPPDALKVFLETFEGPLDLLLYLIKKDNFNILDIPVAEIVRQYLTYIELMTEFRLELSADYLVMAAWLAEIKSKMLLPQHTTTTEEADPRAELVRRLQEYERFKQMATTLDELPRVERDIYLASVLTPPVNDQTVASKPPLPIEALLQAWQHILQRASWNVQHAIPKESLSVRERMSGVLQRTSCEHFVLFSELFDLHEGRMGVVVTFLAILELVRQSLLEWAQTESFGPVYIRRLDLNEDFAVVNSIVTD